MKLINKKIKKNTKIKIHNINEFFFFKLKKNKVK